MAVEQYQRQVPRRPRAIRSATGEREHFDAYLDAYEHCLNATLRPWAPWYAIPADNKHFMRWQVARLVNEALDSLNADFPRPGAAERAELAEAKTRLEREGRQ